MNLLDSVGSLLDGKGHDVWSVSPQRPVYEALKLMADKHIGALLVMSADCKLVGLISERDYARKVILRGKSSMTTEVREIMSTRVAFVAPGNSVQDCMRIMTDDKVRHLPVVENEKVLGVVSIGDVVKWIISDQASTIQQLQHYITDSYPG